LIIYLFVCDIVLNYDLYVIFLYRLVVSDTRLKRPIAVNIPFLLRQGGMQLQVISEYYYCSTPVKSIMSYFLTYMYIYTSTTTVGLGSPNFQLIANLVVNPNIPFPYAGASIAETLSSGSSSSSTGTTTTDSKSLAVAIAALVVACLTLIVVIALAVMKPQQVAAPVSQPAGAPVESGELYNKLMG
jgi:hypothetical protein